MIRQFKTLAATSATICTQGGEVHRIHGFWDGAAAAYLQIHDAVTLPADTAVPLFTYEVQADTEFTIEFNPPLVVASGAFACFSSTRATKTLSTGAGNVGDFIGAVETLEPAGLTQGTIGGVDDGGAALWTDETGSKLYRVQVSGAAASRWLQVHALGEMTDQAVPLFSHPLDGGACDVCFGRDGWAVNAAADGSCFIVASSTALTYTAVTDAQATCNVWHFAGV